MKKTINMDLCDACEVLYRNNKVAGKGFTDGSFCPSCTAKIVNQAKPAVKNFSNDELKSVLKTIKFD